MIFQEIKQTLDLLQAHQTQKEFEDMVANNRTIYLCKNKGFPILKKMGWIKEETQLQKPRKQMFQVGDVVKWAKLGLTTNEIGKKFNCTGQAVSKKLRRLGYTYDKTLKEYILL